MTIENSNVNVAKNERKDQIQENQEGKEVKPKYNYTPDWVPVKDVDDGDWDF